ncbi:transposase [Synechocystis sp. PCC 6803]|uniref:Transposase n=1 Tax=Synechocystis sp. (strain ATCC 27184 / PCC 6803 / Kazusa) TaxID=1111708 RepID=P73968_SYNY3|nr:transposase [Synechocystis sp. PCC 6803]BAL29207.1 transposase [Synechocystis sp. PCC 6803 substr. GT-I]BAL32376.1 transposase [Synechocystis sp. PCC 6803 substr. PCC-N]BAL35545.1 transposase [Synechocystis sp. PCC 6803 substr. PCC-P]BAM51795.1 transposase [Synechocystis sp. PCC 6803] [Bacillus subtilis BEST7613]
MAYSLDLRQRVVAYIEAGGKITEASKIYKIGKASIYRWLNRVDLSPTKVERRHRKLDWEALKKDVEENPDARLIDRAKKFGVRPSAVYYALKKMKINRKKKELRYRERNREERVKYYRMLRELIKLYGSQAIVYINTSLDSKQSRLVFMPGQKKEKKFMEIDKEKGESEKI